MTFHTGLLFIIAGFINILLASKQTDRNLVLASSLELPFMVTISGPATHCQHTVKVTRGGERSAHTQYIQFFRINGQQVTFQSSRPVSIADGDEMVAAGVVGAAGMTAYAVRNMNTGVSVHSGTASRIILGIFIVFFGLFFTNVLSRVIGMACTPLMIVFFGVAIFQFNKARLAGAAMRQVQSYRDA